MQYETGRGSKENKLQKGIGSFRKKTEETGRSRRKEKEKWERVAGRNRKRH
jgi:hypothetical protein